MLRELNLSSCNVKQYVLVILKRDECVMQYLALYLVFCTRTVPMFCAVLFVIAA